MIKKYLFISYILVLSNILLPQDLLVQSPQQLGISTSTARVGNWVYASSGLVQSFYSDEPRASLSLYIPYFQLTDGNVRTSTLQFYSPSYRWGGLSLEYLDYTAENFDKKIFSLSSLKFGYTESIADYLIMALQLNWQKKSWYSDRYDHLNLEGISLDFSALYIINGYSSVGVSITNILRFAYSSIKQDAVVREFRTGYSWLDKSTSFSLEGGIVSGEDVFFQRKIGGFFSLELSLPLGFRIGAEYKHLFMNEVGVVLSYDYQIANFNTIISYGIRIDDSPMPISILQQSWGIHLALNNFKTKLTSKNPQILLRDISSPKIKIKRLSDYTIYSDDVESKILKIQIHIEDLESGLQSVQFNIVPARDSTNILYEKNYSISGQVFEDTIQFNGYLDDHTFLQNDRYLVCLSASDNKGNVSISESLPFRILALKNDRHAPDISVEFDNSKIILSESESSAFLSALVTVNDKEGDWVSWKVQLYKMEIDSVWRGLKHVTGGIEINKRKFDWLLRNSQSQSLAGQYKIKVEARDELNNLSTIWSEIKEIKQLGSGSGKRENIEREKHDESIDEIGNTTISTVVYLPPEDEVNLLHKPEKYFTIGALYFYRNNEVILSDFYFTEGEKFNPYNNQNGLSIIGVYLQDLPNAHLLVECPNLLANIPEVETGIQNFLHEAYGIDKKRIVIKNTPTTKKLIFNIKE